MQPAHDTRNLPALDDQARHTALRAVLKLLDLWQCTEKEKTALLGVGRSTLHKYQSRPESARVSNDLLERLSYLLNIHQVLRTLFGNRENVYGFVRMPNHNAYFNGTSPMEAMSTGRVASLYEVFRHLDSLRGGQW
ncbi:MbcA/ParS/Xre antitoxin family protein [Alcanivorax sp. 24]|uniref:MbcA/ParS/Xre antitoxin family protein n=1 Tax=Alcanivorax sp. 24 TaxID=2545266 RepID=UPI00105EF403|nr:MbcA/ParS/Xre antitoxin family protein [Alcanivorax sp. 24]